MKNILYLGSKSESRKMLLELARIPFTVVQQDADESQCDWALPLPQLVANIAHHKMEHVVVPAGNAEGDYCFVLTVDTMSHDSEGVVHGKPQSRDDAIAKIKAARNGSVVYTAFCLDKKVWHNGVWVVQERITDIVQGSLVFDVPDEWMDRYLAAIPFMDVAGAIAVEYYGNQFLKTVSGSYTTIVGLPLYEVRCALEKLGFFALKSL